MAEKFAVDISSETKNANVFVEQLAQNALPIVAKATKIVNALPSGDSRTAFCAYPSFGKIIDVQSDIILNTLSKVLKYQNVKGNIERRQQDEQFEMILDCNDVMLERINSSLDDLSGIRKQPKTVLVESKLNSGVNELVRSGVWNSKSNNVTTNKLITGLNIPRPQVNFTTPVDNSADKPFKPKIKLKPYALTPLKIIPEYDNIGNIKSYVHPYEHELLKFEPPNSQLQVKLENKPEEMIDSEYIFVDNKQKLLEVLDDLKKEKEIAIDLEHHSYRTFQGITCLMQISSSKNDYIIDTLVLRDDLEIMNEIFTNPNILKIFHGALLDIEWLQRDLGLYVINMFDTHEAAKMLGLNRLSLRFLLKHYCNIDADKTFQLADWRIRPLPTELIYYARQDTHYLIYIASLLHNELLNQPNGLSTLKVVYNQSKEICRRRYIKPTITEDSHMDMYRKSKRAFDNRQLYALREIYLWRDKVARFEDESCGYVLPNHMLLQIAESLPREMQGILACCNPIPSLVRQNLNILHKIVLKAREQPLVKKVVEQEVGNRVLLPSKDFTSKLNCLYDTSHEPEFRADLVPISFAINFEDSDFNFHPILDVFENKVEKRKENYKINKSRNTKFASPYQRYKAVIPIVEKEKQEEISKIQKQNENILLCPFKTAVNEDVILVKKKEVIPTSSNSNSRLKTDFDSIDKSENKNIMKKENNENEKISFFLESHTATKTTQKESKLQFPINVKSTNVSTKQNNSTALSKNNLKKESNFIENKKKNFDYSKVDFKKFQGGSQKHEKLNKKGVNLKSKKINPKKYGKFITFGSKNNGNKKKK